MLESELSKAGPDGPGETSIALPGTGHRIASIDVLRGLVMILMALDYTRDFFSNAAFDPTDLDKTTLSYFFTRWVTHFCAPVFVFLAGTSAFLKLDRSRDGNGGESSRREKNAMARYLVSRGLWLILLELTVVNIGWNFAMPEFIFLQVIWALGVSMIVLAGLIYLPIWAILAFGLVMVGGHNMLDGINPKDLGDWSSLWKILHDGHGFKIFEFVVWPAYPLVPWVGVMALGYVFGVLFRQEEERRNKVFIGLGLILTAAFVLLRFSNIYGDPEPWEAEIGGLGSLLSFLNTDKFPPSLLFLLMTMGPAIFFLAFADKLAAVICHFLALFGRVPLFFYLVHIYFIHMAVLVVGVAGGFTVKDFLGGYWHMPRGQGFGFDLGWVFLIWLLVIAALYPVCRWYAALKHTSKHPFFSYL